MTEKSPSHAALPVEHRLLIDWCAAVAARRSTASPLPAQVDSPDLDHATLLDQAIRHKLLGILATHWADPIWPPSYRDLLLGMNYQHRARGRALRTELARVLKRFSSAGVRVLARKGAYLAEHAYHDDCVRQMTDWDFYVLPAEVGRLREVVSELGYQQGSVDHTDNRVAPLSRRAELFWKLNASSEPGFYRLTDDALVPVLRIDARHQMLEPASGKELPTVDLFERAMLTHLAGTSAEVLSAEDLVLDLCVHLHREATTLAAIERGKDLRLIWYTDIAAVFVTHTKLRLPVLCDLAERYHIQAEVYFALHLTELLFPGTVSDLVLGRLRPADLSYLDEYGQLDGQPGRWSAPFMTRLFDARRQRSVQGRSQLIFH